MPPTPFNLLYGSCWYFKMITGQPVRQTSADLLGIPDTILAPEPARVNWPLLNTSASRLTSHKAIAEAFVAANASLPQTVPFVFNVESYTAAGDFAARLTGPPWGSNLRAAAAVLDHIRLLCPGRRIAAYAPAPRNDFFACLGQDANGYSARVAKLWENEQRMNLEYLAPSVDFWVLDGYIQWGKPLISAGVPDADIMPWLRSNSSPILDYWYGRFPSTVNAGYGVHYGGDSAAAQWVSQFIQAFIRRVEMVEKYGGARPYQIWTSSQFLNNGTIWCPRPPVTDPSEWTYPIYQLLVDEADFRAILDAFVAGKPESCVIFEGWSDEKATVFQQYAPTPPTTTHPSYWPVGNSGGLEWRTADPKSVHPYIENVIKDYKPA